ncbi:MAG TPA: acyl-CoA dehydrogenase family protein [Burkholderiales bacterium]|nr:acyl-CoA dehydrogenase family protein [Burkholderiales bacterium]
MDQSTTALESAYFTEELVALREQVARFVANEVEPHGEAWEKEGHVPRDVLRKMGEMGLFGITYPAEHGGSESDALTSLVYAEALSRSTFGGFVVTALVHSDMASPHLVHAGSKAQIDKYLPGIIRGEKITAVAVTEPDAGSDVAAIRTRARRDGDSWVINGAKMFITNGVLADLYFVAARTDPQAKGSRGISMFIVEKGTPGFRVGRALDKMGWRSSDTAELVFEDCRVPAENLLGDENGGFYAVMKNFQRERIAAAAMAVGNAMTSLKLTIEYVKTRKAFGATLFDKQAIRQRLAMLEAKTHASRQFMYHCAWLTAQGRECVREVSMLKALTGELANEVVYTCQQFHGGMGYMRESVIERQARDARVLTIGGGATEVMLEEVAKRFAPD